MGSELTFVVMQQGKADAITRRNFDINTERVALRCISQKYYLKMEFPPRKSILLLKVNALYVETDTRINKYIIQRYFNVRLVVHSVTTVL
jgi:hypothetical protein